MSPEAAELAARLQVAAAYMAHINAALTGKHGLEEVEAIVAEVRQRHKHCIIKHWYILKSLAGRIWLGV
jgi:hypothetical protein